jgi:hypothetical protein
MNLGQSVLCRYNGEVHEGKVIKIFPEELEIELYNGEVIRRKFWEIRQIKNEE